MKTHRYLSLHRAHAGRADAGRADAIRPYRGLALALIVMLAILTAGVAHSQHASARSPQSAIRNPQSPIADALILLEPFPDLSSAYTLAGKEERGRWVYDALRDHANNTQAAVVAELEGSGAAYTRYWAVNAIHVQADAATLTRLAALPQVQEIVSNAPFRAVILPEPADFSAASTAAIPWGVERVQAPWAWAAGYTGDGVVVSGQDTGYKWDHPALLHAYRGYDAGLGAVDHNYNWHDAIHQDIPPPDGFNPCGYGSLVPCDDDNHGTHTMGTIVGNDLDPGDTAWPAGAPNAIGVAPGAKWIGCRNMDNGWGTPATYIECFQWLIAPHPFSTDPFVEGDPDKAPDVINNSWTCPPSEGCTLDKRDILQSAVDAADAAGIVVVAAAGNQGPTCGTVRDPIAIYGNTYAVGATQSDDGLASFSSRGPVVYQGETMIKPQVSAPGSGVRSAVRGNNYANFSGTSMAAPHTAGVIALLLQAEPSLRGRSGLIKAIVARSAEPVFDFVCGGEAGGHPNNRFGWGIVNARRAIESLAQTGFIAGAVTDIYGRPLKGAQVQVYDLQGQLKGSASADAQGSYNLVLPWGEYQVRFSRFAYISADAEPVYVAGGQTTQLKATLQARTLFTPLILR